MTRSSLETLQITTSSQKAVFTIYEAMQGTVFEGMTPAFVTLAKSDGEYFGKRDYVLIVSETGFESCKLRLKLKTTGAYWLGNLGLGLALGGVPALAGWLIVDPFTGAMYEFEHNPIVIKLQKAENKLAAAPPINATSLPICQFAD